MKIKPNYSPEDGTGGAPALETPPVSTPEVSNESPDVRAMLDWDPFELPKENANDAAPSQPGTPPGKEGEAKTSPRPSEVKKVAGADEEVPADPPLLSPKVPDPLQSQLAEITRLLAEDKAAKAKPEGTKDPAPQGPRFAFSIPSQITKAIFESEDLGERSAGMTALVNGLSNSIYNELSQEFEARQRAIIEAIPRISSQTVREITTQEGMVRDFYGTFTDLPKDESGNVNPIVQNVVQQTAQAYATELKNAGKTFAWTPEFRNEVGKRVYSLLNLQLKAAPNTQTPPVKPNGRVPKPASFASGGSGARSSALPPANEVVKDIMDTFDIQ